MSFIDNIYTRLDHPWTSEILGPNGLPLVTRPTICEQRDRARRLERESSLAHGILDRCVENVIGSGMNIRPKSSSADFNTEIGALYAQWTSGKNADVRRMYSFPQLQRLAFRAKKRDGDVGFILIDRTDQGYTWPELQFVEGDFIESPTGALSPTIYEGIDYNASNAPTTFYIKSGNTHIPVAARDFVYLHNTVRYNVGRGQSSYIGSYRLFDQLEGHIEAVVVAARIAASQAMIAKRKNAGQAVGALPKTRQTDGRLAPAKIIEPGMINYIDTDEELVGFNPTQPHQDFRGFIVTVARMLGLKFGLTVERVLLDFSDANYSVSRSTALQEQRAAEPEQQEFAASFFDRIYPWFVSKMIQLGRIKATPPADAWAYEWIPQGRPLVEPSKEAPGLEKLIQLGLEAPEYLATERGYDWNKLLDTLEKNKKEFSDRGLPWPGESPGSVQDSTKALQEANAAEDAAKTKPANED